MFEHIHFHKQFDVNFDLSPTFFNDAIKIVVHEYGYSIKGTVNLDSACRYAYHSLANWPMQNLTKLAYFYMEEEIVKAIKEAVLEAILNDEITKYCVEVLK